MTYRFIRSVPWLIAFVVTLAAWQWHRMSRTRVQPFESWLLDQRVMENIKKEPATKDIGVVMIDDDSMLSLKNEYRWTWPLPRFVYGVVLRDLAAESASTVAFDMSFESSGSALHNEHLRKVPSLFVPPNQSSDQFFAESLKQYGNAIIGVSVSREKAIGSNLPDIAAGARAVGHMKGDDNPYDNFRHVEPYVLRPDGSRLWQLGILAAANKLGLDLAKAEDQSSTWWHSRRLVIPRADGSVLTIPLQDNGQLLVHWSIPFGSKDLPQPPIKPLAEAFSSGLQRSASEMKTRTTWSDRVVFIGCTGRLTPLDVINSPYAPKVPGVSMHMNVAASLLNNRFNWSLSEGGMFLLLGLIAVFATYVTWHLRVEWATLSVLLLAVCYGWFTDFAYEHWLLQLPMLSPIVGAAGASYLSVLGFRMIVERGHAGRVKNLFERLVAPDVIEILMQQRTLPWDTTQRPVTVLFADIRGFTAYTDQQEMQAAREIEELNLTGEAAAACRNRYAAESLETVNLYLGTIVDAVKKHGATLDKYIGDCVMAFWGAPLADSRHAAKAVRAAIDAQRQVEALNSTRKLVNQHVTGETTAGPVPRQLPILSLGIAIHTGEMIVGFMGSERHLSNYTVFGRNVNIASRVEKHAEGGCIVTTKATYDAVQAFDPALASSLFPLRDVEVKGIVAKLGLFEVRS